MYAKQNPMICGTTGTSGTCGTSFEEHVVLVVLLWEHRVHRVQEEQQLKQHTDIASHVIQPDLMRNNIRIRCTKICTQACINLVHNKKPQHFCRGSCQLTTTTIRLLQPQCRHTLPSVALSHSLW